MGAHTSGRAQVGVLVVLGLAGILAASGCEVSDCSKMCEQLDSCGYYVYPEDDCRRLSVGECASRCEDKAGTESAIQCVADYEADGDCGAFGLCVAYAVDGTTWGPGSEPGPAFCEGD